MNQSVENKLLIKKNLRKCKKCGIIKPITDFYKRANRKSGFASSCNICSRGSFKNSRLFHHYNMTQDDWNKMFDLQKGKCLICGKHQSDVHLKFHVDHNHDTGEIRGLLCFKCNVGLGNFDDSVELINNALEYLKKFN